jgi:copper transport protein
MRSSSRLRRLSAGVAAAIATVIVVAAPASAHATLESTDPSDGAVVATAPGQVAAQFDESVGVSADSLRVFSPTGDRVDDGTTTHGGEDSVITTNLRSNLPQGTYTVAWHVISADSHPVSGAFTFSIGKPSRTTVNPAAIITRASVFEGWLYGIARWAAYLAFSALIGTVFFLAMCWPKGARSRGAFRMIAAGWTVLVATSVAELLLQGVYAGGLPISRLVDPTVIRATTSSRFGNTVEVRLLLLAIAAPALTIGVQRIDGMAMFKRLQVGAVTLLFGGGLAATWAATGHASTGIQVPVSVLSDVLHLTAMAVWIGGLACLSLLVLRRADKPKQASNAVRRFSGIALICVCVMVVTGTYQAWRDVGSISALTDSAYGRMVLLKVLGILGLITLGYYARTWIATGFPKKKAAAAATATAAVEAVATAEAEETAEEEEAVAAEAMAADVSAGKSVATAAARSGQPGRSNRPRSSEGPAMRRPGRRTARVGNVPKKTGAPGDPMAGTVATLRRLRWSVTAEAGIAVCVLGVTAALVNSLPGRTASGIAGQPGATDVSLSFNTGTQQGTVLVVIEPGTVGLNQAHLLFQDSRGFQYSPAEVDISYTLPARNLGPITSTVENDGQGHYVENPVTLPFAGQWQVALTIRSDNFDETTLHIPMTVAQPQ